MFCRDCGTENDDNAKFCRNCGLPIVPVEETVGPTFTEKEKTSEETASSSAGSVAADTAAQALPFF